MKFRHPLAQAPSLPREIRTLDSLRGERRRRITASVPLLRHRGSYGRLTNATCPPRVACERKAAHFLSNFRSWTRGGMDAQDHKRLDSGCRLPVEIISMIVRLVREDLDYRTLASLARVNKHLCGQCQTILYHTVSNLDREFGGNPQSLQRSPRLARYVHTYIIQHSEFCRHLDTRKTDVAPLRPGPISKNLVNLKDLHVQLNRYSPNKFLEFKRTPFHLENFSWVECPRLSTLLDFLKTQPKLRRLKTDLYYEQKNIPFPLRYCPNLEYLEGSRAVVESLLPGRKISTLVWHVSQNLFANNIWPKTFDHLADEFVLLKALSLIRWQGGGSPFSFVSPKYFKNLQYLELSDEVRQFVMSSSQYSNAGFMASSFHFTAATQGI
ncbi:unnamed protein product [Cyclocybe aegerita]|uniref:Uncharacterized protein n=1 Tax=Cyclocybe aegerita TaxID=1973307 RepID=A0A8S0X1V9_CYCAE|nr:unnamed protein product [Cyclocybe aegerita]